ncbi:MAG: hypothetical protein WCJ25_04355 [Candidatus Moraniibacteriota bacterium]
MAGDRTEKTIDLVDIFANLASIMMHIPGLTGLLGRPKGDGVAKEGGEKEREVPTNIFTKEDEAVMSQLEMHLDSEHFDILSRLYEILDKHQADNFRYYIVKQNQIEEHENRTKTKKQVKTGSSAKGPERDELFEEFERIPISNLYKKSDIRTRYLAFIAGKILELDKDGKGEYAMKHILIKRHYIREKSLQQEAKEKVTEEKDKALDATYWFLMRRRLGKEKYKKVLGTRTEEDARKDTAFHDECLAALAVKKEEEEEKEATERKKRQVERDKVDRLGNILWMIIAIIAAACVIAPVLEKIFVK